MSLKDMFSNPIKGAADNLRSLGTTAEGIRPKFDKMDGGISKARQSTRKLKEDVDKISPSTKKNTQNQEQHNEKMRQGAGAAGKLLGALKTVVGVSALLAGGKQFIGMSDELSGITSRLAMINDGQQTVTQLNQQIFESAERSRGSYMDTADTVAKLGMQTGDLFETNKELITFAEVLNKQFKISATPLESQRSAMLQLNQAMGSGVLRGDEFNAIFEASPGIIELISKEMGVSVGQMRALAAEGAITSDVVKSALLGAVDETNEKFAQMPKTWGAHVESFKNNAIQSLTPVSLKFNELINSRGFTAMFSVAIQGVQHFANMMMVAMIVSENVMNFIYDNWSALEPLFIVIGGALAAYVIKNLVLTGIQATIAIGKMIAGFIMANLPILLVGASIAMIIYTFNQLGITAGDVVGFIVGSAYAMAAILQNIGLFIGNLFIALVEKITNLVIFFVNLWNQSTFRISKAWNTMVNGLFRGFANFINGGIRLAEGFVNFFIRGINKIITSLNSLQFTLPDFLGGGTFGVNLNTVGEWSAPRMDTSIYDANDAAIAQMQPKDTIAYKQLDRMEYKNVGDAFAQGQQKGFQFANAVGDKVGGLKDMLQSAKDSVMGDLNARGQVPGLSQPGGALDPLDAGAGGKGQAGKALKDTAGNTADIGSTLKRSTDDLGAIRDLMTQRAITNISWDKIEVKVDNNFGDVHKEADLDGFLDTVSNSLLEAVNSTMTGVTVLE